MLQDKSKTIKIKGKVIDYGNMSDEKLLQLYKELKKREELLYIRILKGLEESNLVENKN